MVSSEAFFFSSDELKSLFLYLRRMQDRYPLPEPLLNVQVRLRRCFGDIPTIRLPAMRTPLLPAIPTPHPLLPAISTPAPAPFANYTVSSPWYSSTVSDEAVNGGCARCRPREDKTPGLCFCPYDPNRANRLSRATNSCSRGGIDVSRPLATWKKKNQPEIRHNPASADFITSLVSGGSSPYLDIAQVRALVEGTRTIWGSLPTETTLSGIVGRCHRIQANTVVSSLVHIFHLMILAFTIYR